MNNHHHAAAPAPVTRYDHAADRRYLHTYAMSQVRDPVLADDLVQETFLAALTTPAAFDGRSARRTWLAGILRHKMLDTFRARTRDPLLLDDLTAAPAAADDLNAPPAAELVPQDGGGPEDALRESRLFRQIESALEALPPRTARAFVLGDILGHDAREISAMLDAAPADVWGMMHRARQSLRRTLDARGH